MKTKTQASRKDETRLLSDSRTTDLANAYKVVYSFGDTDLTQWINSQNMRVGDWLLSQRLCQKVSKWHNFGLYWLLWSDYKLTHSSIQIQLIQVLHCDSFEK